MLPDLERLIRLQQIDLDVAAARQSIDHFPEQSALLDDRLNACRTALDEVEAGQVDQKAARVRIEKELAEVDGRLSRFKDQLMAVKTNKEFHAVQLEIANAEAAKQSHEDRLLELMIAADEILAEADAARAALQTAEEEVAKARQAIEAERDRLQAGRRKENGGTRDARCRHEAVGASALRERGEPPEGSGGDGAARRTLRRLPGSAAAATAERGAAQRCADPV